MFSVPVLGDMGVDAGCGVGGSFCEWHWSSTLTRRLDVRTLLHSRAQASTSWSPKQEDVTKAQNE